MEVLLNNLPDGCEILRFLRQSNSTTQFNPFAIVFRKQSFSRIYLAAKLGESRFYAEEEMICPLIGEHFQKSKRLQQIGGQRGNKERWIRRTVDLAYLIQLFYDRLRNVCFLLEILVAVLCRLLTN